MHWNYCFAWNYWIAISLGLLNVAALGGSAILIVRRNLNRLTACLVNSFRAVAKPCIASVAEPLLRSNQ
jgi:hypothetical protein